MQLKLEEVLKEKEKELKLYQRFIDLKQFCEENIFPLSDLPLKQHVEDLKHLIEKIIPDPKDRTEEMFSGEIFTLLGMIYLHDIGLVKGYEWNLGGMPLSSLDSPDKQMLANCGIGERLGIPEMAIEIINYLTFSEVLKKLPLEWEITAEGRKAIIRNTRFILGIFNFSHLLLDIFGLALRYKKLRRFNDHNFVLRDNHAQLDVDNRKGIISVKYDAKLPYEMHVLDSVKVYVDNHFGIFKDNINGKLGFSYHNVVWDVRSDFSYERDIFEIPKLSPFCEFEGPPLERWEKASKILDTMFNFGYAMAVGDLATGKTTVLRSFVMPQIMSISPHVFYCELWEKPVSEIKDIIWKRHRDLGGPDLDIISLCNMLLNGGPCFFVLDNCERYLYIDASEQAKLERFITFCLECDNIYLIAAGDKETFFEWYAPFSKMSMSVICEIKPIDSEKAICAYGEDKVSWDANERYKPIECQLLQANLSMEKILEDILESAKDDDDLRRVVAVFVDRSRHSLMRHTLESVYFETAIPQKRILGYLNFLKERDILKQFESIGQVYYAMSSRYMMDPLYKVLRLEDFEDYRRLRNILHNSIVNETVLDDEVLALLEQRKDHLIFSKEEMGLILLSLILQARDFTSFFDKAKTDGVGIDIQPVLKLLYIDDPEKRRKAVELLVEIQDKDMINPLLAHLRREDTFEIKDLLVRGIGLTGKKRTILAIMDVLKEIGDRKLKLKAIEFFHSLLDGNIEHILAEIREVEEDPVILVKIDSLLATMRET